MVCKAKSLCVPAAWARRPSRRSGRTRSDALAKIRRHARRGLSGDAEQLPMVGLANSVLAVDADESSVADAVRIRDALAPLLIPHAGWLSAPADIALTGADRRHGPSRGDNR